MNYMHCFSYSGAENTFYLMDISNHSKVQGTPGLEIHNLLAAIKDQLPPLDGIVFMTKLGSAKIAWEFYNWDGSSAAMCGNAARCAALFSEQVWKMNLNNTVQLETLSGHIRLFKQGSDFCISQPVGKTISIHPNFIVDTGVPHTVIKLSVLDYQVLKKDSLKLESYIQSHRYPELLDDKGGNITFVCETSEGQFLAKTFERGVETITQACGTGAMAAALFFKQSYLAQSQFLIEMPGGRLGVKIQDNDEIILWGPTVQMGEHDFVIK